MVKGLHTHLVPREMEARGVDEREEMGRFYTACVLPQASSHSKQAVIFPDSPQMQIILPNGRVGGFNSPDCHLFSPFLS